MTAVRRIVGGLVVALAALGTAPRAAAGQRSSPTETDCVACHPSVHATMIAGGQKTAARCLTCHARAHEAVGQLFTGAGTDSAVLPDKMYAARVACRGCHTDAELAATAATRTAALTRACTSCHGPSYGGMLSRWTDAMNRRTRLADAYVAGAEADSQLTARPTARSRVASARADVALVIAGNGLHNIPGADALLRSAVGKVGTAYRAAGLAAPTAPALGPDPATVSCAYCHYGVEAASGTLGGQPFSHADHVLRADVACTQCHSSANYFVAGGHEADPAHGKTTVTAAACSACHHVSSGLACTTCHLPQVVASRPEPVTLPLILRPPDAPTSRAVDFRHGAHATLACTSCHASPASIRSVAACTSCHVAHHRQATDCTACHGTGLLAVHTAKEHLACAQCHARETLALVTGNRTFCLACHVDRRDHHPGRDCAPCHLQMSPAEVQAKILGGQR
jgi:Class III cytochrome C family